MTSKHIETRRKLQSLATVDEFSGIIDTAMLSRTDKDLLWLHYVEGKDLRYIGDTLGYSEQTIKNRHRKALKTIGYILDTFDEL